MAVVAFVNKDDKSGQPVVVMEIPGERSVPVVGSVVEGKHLLWGRTVDKECCFLSSPQKVWNHQPQVGFTTVTPLTVPQTELLLLFLL